MDLPEIESNEGEDYVSDPYMVYESDSPSRELSDDAPVTSANYELTELQLGEKGVPFPDFFKVP